MVRIAIIGGGIGGLTTAIALRQFGFDPDVYEQAPVLLDVGAAIALWPNATRVLAHLGLADQILQLSGEMDQVCWLDQTGRLINRVTLHEAAKVDSPAIALHRADLQSTLLKAVPQNTIHLAHSLINFEQTNNKVTAHFANGHSINADILIGADGIHSHVRSHLLNDGEPIYRGYTVWRGVSPINFNSIPARTAIELHGSGQRFGIGPVGAGKVGWWASMNAANTSLKANERRSDQRTFRKGETFLPDRRHDTQRELLRLFDGWHRPVIQLIESTASSSILKTGAFDRRPNKKWGESRVTLLGDAIHPVTPNFGQGGCMAIEDAMVLARCLRDHGTDEQALRRYETLRYTRTTKITRYSRIYGSIGQWNNIWARALRRSMLSLVPESVARRLMEIVFDYDACNEPI
jgi:2-polyprenyl-6-methoxyphenol hydroxylase-like FAD-dependent oxidoreductase